MGWITNHAEAISAIASVFTLFVWVFYAQLLYANYSRQRRPRIIINRGQGKFIHSLCLVSNMSQESIYVQHIVAVLETSDGKLQFDISEFQQSEDGDSSDINQTQETEYKYRTHQGPLGSGEYLHVGSFNDILRGIAKAYGIEMLGYHPRGDMTFDALEIRLIAVYGPEDSPIGARRRFLLKDSKIDEYAVYPDSLDTERLNSRRQRRRIKRWMRELASQETDAGKD